MSLFTLIPESISEYTDVVLKEQLTIVEEALDLKEYDDTELIELKEFQLNLLKESTNRYFKSINL